MARLQGADAKRWLAASAAVNSSGLDHVSCMGLRVTLCAVAEAPSWQQAGCTMLKGPGSEPGNSLLCPGEAPVFCVPCLRDSSVSSELIA